MVDFGTIYTNMVLDGTNPSIDYTGYIDNVSEETITKYFSFYNNEPVSDNKINLNLELSNFPELVDNNENITYDLNGLQNLIFYLDIVYHGKGKKDKTTLKLQDINLFSYSDNTLTILISGDNGDLSYIPIAYVLGKYDKAVCTLRVDPTPAATTLENQYYDLCRFTLKNSVDKIYVRNDETVVLKG